MAAISKSGTPTVSTASPSFEHQQAGLLAAVEIKAGDACSLNSNGQVVLYETGLRFRGIAASDCPVGDSVTLYQGVSFYYGKNLTPNTEVFLSETVPGGLDDAGTVPVGYVVDRQRIFFYPLSSHTPTT
jgi:hypothetical protein